jgi:hypothetical protein
MAGFHGISMKNGWGDSGWVRERYRKVLCMIMVGVVRDAY